MTISNGQLSKMICVACGDPFGDHSKRTLIRCIFRIQGSVVHQKVKENV
jgi:hypothetical protein